MLLAGIDMGYRTAEHDGLNHIQCMLEAEYALSEHWTILAYAAHSVAREDVKREMLGRSFLGGDWTECALLSRTLL